MSYIRKGEALFVTVLNGAYDSSAVVMVMVKVNAILDFFIGGEKMYHFHANNYFISSWLIRFLLNPCFICISKSGQIGAIVKQFYWIKTLKITETDWSKKKKSYNDYKIENRANKDAWKLERMWRSSTSWLYCMCIVHYHPILVS